MELKGIVVPQFCEVCPPRITRKLVKRTKRIPLLCNLRVSSYHIGETFPVSYNKWKTIKVQCNDSSQSIQKSSVSKNDSSRMPDLTFDRLQLNDQENCGVDKRGFGRFIARGAVLDEEYWTAAWLRAEAHWESVSYMRNADSYKRKYAEQILLRCKHSPIRKKNKIYKEPPYIEEEFYALKCRCSGRDRNSLKCFCLVTVKKEEKNVRRTVLNSVVGTLDLSIRQFLQGEKFPGELKRSSAVFASHEACDAHKYAYIANVCVSKFTRRQGIACNMMYLATDLAISAGIKQLFVHVNADNRPAQELYRKTGFEMVEAASSPLSKDQRLLMCMQLC